MLLQPKPQLSFDDWLEGERADPEYRSEYVNGEVFAMTGARAEHNGIVTNLVRELSIQFKGRPCQVYANDMKVRVRSANAGHYPDIVAFCGAPEFLDGRRDVLMNPALIVEVLSNSTEAYDRGQKFRNYQQIPTLRDYLLVAQYQVRVEHYARGPDDRWGLTPCTALPETLTLDSVGGTLALAEVYDKVEFIHD
ncbi:MAG TPA: Uma2 family endonuclease [Lamprocystis sp. (in: g-proteobacteria)]|nr:Uma2 family endonuclease [Lamprocystis sp. (in: g-proteobacteria)]